MLTIEEAFEQWGWPEVVRRVDEKIEELVCEQPDYVYKSMNDQAGCWYGKGPDGEPGGCILGQAFHRAGITVMGWDDIDSCDSGATICNVLEELVGESGPSRWEKLQSLQDSGRSWRDSWIIATA